MADERTRIVGPLTLRPARPSDKHDVEELCAQIWDGGDYVPEVWDRWLADPEGQLSVAERDGKVVGLGKLTRLSPDEWWLEGLRVDPAHRGERISSLLHEYAVERADSIGRGYLRFATSSANVNVHHLAERTGFRRAGNYILMKAEARPDLAHRNGLSPLTGADLPEAEAALEPSPLLGAAAGLYEDFWKWQKLTPARLRQHAARGMLYGWRPAGNTAGTAVLAGLAVLAAADDERMVIAFADAPGGDLRALAVALRGLAAERGAATVSWKALEYAPLLDALVRAGYQQAHDHSFYIFERPVPWHP